MKELATTASVIYKWEKHADILQATNADVPMQVQLNYPPKSAILSFVQAGETTVQAGDLTVGDWRKKKEDDKLACQWFLIGADLITLNCTFARSCVQKRVHTEPVTLKAHDNEHLGTLWAINHSLIFKNLQSSSFFKYLTLTFYPFLFLIFNNFLLSDSVNAD